MVQRPIVPREAAKIEEKKKDENPNSSVNLEEEEKLNKARNTLKEVEEKADYISKKAKKEAEEILENARQKALEIREEEKKLGWEEGFQKGKKGGEKEGIKAWQELLAKVEEELEKLLLDLQKWRQGLPDELMTLSTDIARQIVGAELKVAPDQVVNRVSRALQEIASTQEVLLKVSPADMPLIEKARENLLKFNGGINNLKIVGEKSLEPGDFLVETDFGGVKGRVENQLQLIYQELQERLKQDEKD